MPPPERRIAHLDMDAFFASVELLRRPELRGQAVVIGGRRDRMPARGDGNDPRLGEYAGRGVVTTATYEARELGVRSGMAMMKAAQLAPEAIVLPADFDAYRDYSRRFKAAVAAITPRIEDRGIDEIYIDLTALDEQPGMLGQRLKEAVRDTTGLSCSLGIASNKLLAKLASELDKPDGLTQVNGDDIATRIWPLPVGRLNGIGPKSRARLEALGVYTLGDLARAEPSRLRQHFSERYAAWLHDAAHGRDTRELVLRSEPKSISRETTFERDLHARADREELGAILTRLCEQLAADLHRKGYAAGAIGVKVRYADFRIVTRNLSLSGTVTEPADIRRAAGRCLRRVPLDCRLRLLGVRAAALVAATAGAHSGSGLQVELPLSQAG